jgi:hypothetical protein
LYLDPTGNFLLLVSLFQLFAPLPLSWLPHPLVMLYGINTAARIQDVIPVKIKSFFATEPANSISITIYELTALHPTHTSYKNSYSNFNPAKTLCTFVTAQHLMKPTKFVQ